ncbi:hypothetical protein [Clostridium scatologenes]|uniref:Uncharacterized protein n=1 Tax=Clostridium scatologenes TaxID=1548 RepID=A0A0E3M689_CLOSL|nr:hypothetical protein [Clostridium scatologenes]AKA67297.1 hypothetical protein CSCA_0172 [Clostridium scatologenes]
MKFYDIPETIDNDIFSNVPAEIIAEIKKLDLDLVLNLKNNEDNNVINIIWNLTFEVCKKYIDINKFENIGIRKDDLFEDIKANVILTIIIAFKYKEAPIKSLRQIVCDYYKTDSKGLMGTDQYNYFKKFWLRFLKSIFSYDNIERIDSTDFYNYFNDSIIKNNGKEYNISFYDNKLFSLIVQNKSLCPYNEKNIFGMTFKNLSSFGSVFNGIFVKSSQSYIDNCIRAYEVERFFNFSFLYELSYFIFKEHKEEIKNPSGVLMDFSNLVSIPMIFSRNKYINMIFNSYKNQEITTSTNKEGNHRENLKLVINYLNYWVLSLMQSVFYNLIFLYSKKNRIDVDYYIESLLVKYIESNRRQYQITDIIGDISNLKNLELPKEIEINITELIYNFQYDRLIIEKGEKIEDFIERLKENFLKGYLDNKYNYYNYNYNFPFNNILSTYKTRKQEKKYKNFEKYNI